MTFLLRSFALGAIAVLGLLSGCAAGSPGVAGQAGCAQQAELLYPAIMVRRVAQGGQRGSGYATTHCQIVGQHIDCIAVETGQSPPTTVAEDTNAVNRQRALDACLKAPGSAPK